MISVALHTPDIAASKSFLDEKGGASSSEQTLPMVTALLAEASVRLQDIDLIVYGRGPGSFTGVRIACGLAQGLAFGLGKRVIGIDSTLALAEATKAAHCLVAIDARMDELYAALYARDPSCALGWREVLSPCLTGTDALPTPSHDVVGIGSGFDHPVLGPQLRQHCGAHLQSVVELAHPMAAALAGLAARWYDREGVVCTTSAADAAPLYLRNRVALTIHERTQEREQRTGHTGRASV